MAISSIWLSISTLELKMVILVPLEFEDPPPHAPSMPTAISEAMTAAPAFFHEKSVLIANPFLFPLFIRQHCLMRCEEEPPTRAVGNFPS